MEETTINQRIKFLVDTLADSVRAFSIAIGEKLTNTSNYVNGRNKPSTEFLERVVIHFKNVNSHWLLTGEGKPFTGDTPLPNQTNISGKKNTVAVAGTNNGTATTNNYNLSDCEKERDTYKRESEDLRAHLETQKHLLDTKDALIASKEELLGFLRGGFNRPN